jgi:hypothetical protein
MSIEHDPPGAVVYRFYDATGTLLYVGSTLNFQRRLAEHKCKVSWWEDVTRIEIARYDDGLSARVAEARWIREEAPKHNRTLGRIKRRRCQDSPEVIGGIVVGDDMVWPAERFKTYSYEASGEVWTTSLEEGRWVSELTGGHLQLVARDDC